MSWQQMSSQPSLGSPCHLLQSLVQGPAVPLGPKLGGGATCPLSTLITERCPLSQFTWSLEVQGGSKFGNSSVPLPLPSTKARTLVPGLYPEHHSPSSTVPATSRGGDAAGHILTTPRTPLLPALQLAAPPPLSAPLAISSPHPLGIPSTIPSRRLAFSKVRISHQTSNSFCVQPCTVP